jgi:hypothetical protein
MVTAGHTRRIAPAALLLAFLCSNASAAGNLVRDGSFETPVVPQGGYTSFSTGQDFGPHWTVVGATGNVAIVSGTFAQNGFTFPAKKGAQWLDLTGNGNTATGVAQTISTVAGENYALTFYIGNLYDPGGIFGTTSTVDLQIDGANVASFTNKCGKGTTKLCWRKFSTDFVVTGTQTTIGFINGDPSNDTSNGLDAVTVVPDPD